MNASSMPRGPTATLIGIIGIIATILFVPAVAFFTFLIFAASPYFSLFAAFVYALLACCISGALFCSWYLKKRKEVENYFFSERIHALKGAVRRAAARDAVRKIREDAQLKQAWETRKRLYKRALTVVLCLMFVAYLGNALLGMYPADLFIIPPQILVALWVPLILFLPDILLIILIFSLTGISFALFLLGPTILMFFIPFLFLMPMNFIMIFLVWFGPLMIINILQIQTFKPTDANWGITPDDVRGQKTAMRALLSQIRVIASPEGEEAIKKLGERARPRGILLYGPPGVGKTHSMKAVATILNAPIMIIPASAFTSAFMGVGIWTMFLVKFLAGNLQRQYKYVVIFFDEAEQILMSRSGVMGGGGAGATGSMPVSLWDVLQRDSYGRIGPCGLGFIRENEKLLIKDSAPVAPTGGILRYMFPGGGMGMSGGSMVQPVLLQWMDGMRSPSMMSRMWRGKVNDFATAFFLPPFVRVGSKTIPLRIPPAAPPPDNAVFIAATNMPHVIDPAFKRFGRFGRHIHYTNPSEEEREDALDLFLERQNEKGILDPDMMRSERRKELARATVGLSHVSIEQVVTDAFIVRNEHIQRLRELKERTDAGDELDEYEKRFWERFKHEMERPDWNRLWVNWDSISEALMNIRSGEANPTITSPRHRNTTAHHEFMGHMIPLRYFCGNALRPVALSIMPRGEALGMVIHVPIEERDPEPQWVFDGLLRVMVGSTVAERMYFGDNQPGVSGDLAQATKLASAMVGLFGMEPRRCSEDEWGRYQKIGNKVYSGASAMGLAGMGGMGMATPSVDGGKHDIVLVLLGQAVTDVWRLLKKNKHLSSDASLVADGVCQKLLEVDEIIGKDLEELWEKLNTAIIPLTEENKNEWPEDELSLENPFYRRGAEHEKVA